MTAAGYTSDDLLRRVKARAQVPDADDRLTDADMLEIADDAIASTVGRIIWNADDGRTVRTQADVALVSGQSDYRLPDRAVGSAVYDVLLVDSAGNEVSSHYVDSADAWRWRNGESATVSRDRAFAHTLEGDVIRLLPTPLASDLSLRLKYRRRPSRLVTLANALGPFSSSSDTTLSGTMPSAWSSVETLDLFLGAPGGDALEDSFTGSISGSTFTRLSGTFDITGPYAIEVGSYAALEGETCVLPVPAEAVPFLTALVAFEVNVALGDDAAAGALGQLVAGRRKELIALVDDRNREDEAIIPRSSHFRAARFGWRH